MIASFAGRGTEDVFDGAATKAARATCPSKLWPVARRKLTQINRVGDLAELAIPPGIASNDSVAIAKGITASGSTINIEFASAGRLDMRTTLKSRITIRRRRGGATVRRPNAVARRLPRVQPPTHPGEMLLHEFLIPLGISQSAFAVRLGISFPRLNEIVRRKRVVTPDTALRLARVLRISAEFWLGLQQDWDLWHAMRTKKAARIAELEPLRRTGGRAAQQPRQAVGLT